MIITAVMSGICMITALVLMTAEMSTCTALVSIPSSWTAGDMVRKLKSGDLTVAQILGPLQPAAGFKYSTLPEYSSSGAQDTLLAGEGDVLPRDRYNQVPYVPMSACELHARISQPLMRNVLFFSSSISTRLYWTIYTLTATRTHSRRQSMIWL